MIGFIVKHTSWPESSPFVAFLRAQDMLSHLHLGQLARADADFNKLQVEGSVQPLSQHLAPILKEALVMVRSLLVTFGDRAKFANLCAAVLHYQSLPPFTAELVADAVLRKAQHHLDEVKKLAHGCHETARKNNTTVEDLRVPELDGPIVVTDVQSPSPSDVCSCKVVCPFCKRPEVLCFQLKSGQWALSGGNLLRHWGRCGGVDSRIRVHHAASPKKRASGSVEGSPPPPPKRPAAASAANSAPVELDLLAAATGSAQSSAAAADVARPPNTAVSAAVDPPAVVGGGQPGTASAVAGAPYCF